MIVRLGTLALDAVLIALAVTSIAGAVVARVLPMTGHELVVVVGGSMEPAIPVGSLVVLENVPIGELRSGDVVSIRAAADRSVVTHRIVRILERGTAVWLELRGDANAQPDPVLVPATAVLGRSILIEPGLGRTLSTFATPSGFLILGGTAGLLYASSLGLRALERAKPQAVMAEPA